MSKETEAVRSFREAVKDYAYNPDIMSDEDAKTARLKEIINTKLNIVDKTIIILYAECASYVKLGKRLGVCHMTARREVLRIREIIMQYYDKDDF